MTERPEAFDGTVTIEWRAFGAEPPLVMPGWQFAIRGTDGTMILTVTEMTLHASADGLVWAELTMFADPDGRPVYGSTSRTQIHIGDDGEILTGTFAYEVAGMSATP